MAGGLPLLLLLLVLVLPVTAVGDQCPSPCRCRHSNIVDCSGKQLTHIPRGIPNGTLVLDLSVNNLPEITRRDLSGMPRLATLNLSYNKISKVGPRVFVASAKLEAFNFTGNRHPSDSSALSDIVCALNDTQVVKLFLKKLGMTYDVSVFHCMESLKLEWLVLDDNRLGYLPDNTFTGFYELRKFSLNSALDGFNPKAFSNLTKLTNLYIVHNEIHSFPNFTLHGRSLLPSLKYLTLYSNQISTISTTAGIGLEKLQILNVMTNRIRRLENNVFARFTHLRQLYLAENNLREIYPYAFNSSTLKHLSMDETHYQLSDADKELFYHCPNMERLDIRGVSLYYLIKANVSVHFFDKMPKLQKLNMRSTHINLLPENIFSKLVLLDELILTNNLLSVLPRGIFKEQTRLTTLYLDGNRFAVFTEAVFPTSLLNHLKVVAFGGNVFACTCRLLWFANWIKHANVSIKGGKHTYKCLSPPNFRNISLFDFPLTEKDCDIQPENLALKLGASFTFVALFILVTVFVSYRCRWHLSSWYFSIKARVRQYREVPDDTEYQFDAFLSYNYGDLPWIRQHVLPILEEENGFKLCLHDRDWLPGPDIVDNIVKSVQNSRKTLMVVSNAFATSQWCEVELTMAQHRLFEEDRNNLVLILLEDIDPDNMTPRLAFQMRSRTYIEWTEDPVGQRLFWRKLIRALNRPDRPVDPLGNPEA